MNSSFVHPALAVGLALVAVPVLIHLINLLRQRRVQWAAMEFLLQSQRKYSRWVRLKELLLLLARMAAVALIVLVVAQPLWSGAWSWRLLDQPVEHLVLLDDSFSMADRGADRDAFDLARQAVSRLVEQWSDRGGAQTVTLLRYSKAGDEHSAPQFDLLQQQVDAQLADQLAGRMQSWRPTDLAVQPTAAVAALNRALPRQAGLRRLVHLVSDFRAHPWDSAGELATELIRLTAAGVPLQLIQTVDTQHENLAVVALEPLPGTRAVGLSLTLHATVQNFGRQAANEVTLQVEQDGAAATSVRLENIPPGETRSALFQVALAEPGARVISVALPNDALAIDNRRSCVIDVAPSVPVLIVAGDPQSLDARYLATVFHPGGSARTGLDVQVEPVGFLDHQPLGRFSAIYLLDVDRLNDSAVDALETYARAGGGVAFFLGPRTLIDFFNRRLYRDGQGLFPMPLAAEMPLLVDRLEHAPDLQVGNHPMFRTQSSQRNSFLGAVTVERFIMAPANWQPPVDAAVQVPARLRNGSPLLVERTFGAGRVMVCTTTAAPLWNNWARNPSFVVTLLELQAYLSAAGNAPTWQLVGTPIRLRLDPARYQSHGRWQRPDNAATDAPSIDFPVDANGLNVVLADTPTAGVYQLHLTTQDGQAHVRRWALDIDPQDSPLQLADPTRIATQLPDVDLEFRNAADIAPRADTPSGVNLSDLCLYLLVGLLVGELGLARAASYLPGTAGVSGTRNRGAA